MSQDPNTRRTRRTSSPQAANGDTIDCCARAQTGRLADDAVCVVPGAAVGGAPLALRRAKLLAALESIYGGPPGGPKHFANTSKCFYDSGVYPPEWLPLFEIVNGTPAAGRGDASHAPCRPQVPPAAPATKAAPAPRRCVCSRPYIQLTGYDLRGADLACGERPFCRVCGGLERVYEACSADSRCGGFTMEPAPPKGAGVVVSSVCGYLKSRALTQDAGDRREGWTFFFKDFLGALPPCSGG
jgi:hypothetical protein